jgi:acetyl esterase
MRKASNMPEVWECTPEELRQNVDSRVALSGKREEVASYEQRNEEIGGRVLHLRVFRPAVGKPLPCIVFYHGGGWVHNTLEIYEASLRMLANRSGHTIVAVEYRKAPEHPYPAPLDDCWDTVCWCREHAEELEIDLARIGVMGDSSGGNLAAAVALRARKHDELSLAFQVLIYPCLDPRLETASALEFAEGFNLSKRAMEWYWQQYVPNASNLQHAEVAPAFEQDLSSLPRTFVATPECDILRDEAREFHARLCAAGVQSTCKEYEGMIHGFFTYGGLTPMCERLVEDIARLLSTDYGVQDTP